MYCSKSLLATGNSPISYYFVMIVIFRYLGENPELNALLKMPSICYCQCEMASRKNQRTLDTSLPGLGMIDEV